MTLSPVASWVLVIWYIVGSLLLTGSAAAMAVVLFKLSSKLDDLTAKLEPLIAKADQLLVVANEKVDSIGTKTDTILDEGNGIVHGVHEKVEKTATVVQRTIHAPIIGLNSFATAVSRGVATFSRLQRRDTHGARAEGVREIPRNHTNGFSNEQKGDFNSRTEITEPSATALNGKES